MIKILVNGCNGKMGQEVIKSIQHTDNVDIFGGFDRENSNLTNFPVYTNINDIDGKPDVIIDFSIPVSTLNILQYAEKENIPIVIATTGFSDDEMQIVTEYSKKIPIFKAANMSFDINLMAKIVSELAIKLENTDIEIIETHHNRKVDAPSGTAEFLADEINHALGDSMKKVYNRHDFSEKRQKNEIGISAVRGGNIVGEHTVKFFAPNETFEITHTSHSRSVFAEGAIKAAKFILNKPVGMYNMNDLVK